MVNSRTGTEKVQDKPGASLEERNFSKDVAMSKGCRNHCEGALTGPNLRKSEYQNNDINGL